jgi:hypothetical protein
MVTPIITTIKNIIDDKEDKKIDNASKFIQQNHHSTHNLGNLEDTYIIWSEDIFTTDSPSSDRSIVTEEEDKNRKF